MYSEIQREKTKNDKILLNYSFRRLVFNSFDFTTICEYQGTRIYLQKPHYNKNLTFIYSLQYPEMNSVSKNALKLKVRRLKCNSFVLKVSQTSLKINFRFVA